MTFFRDLQLEAARAQLRFLVVGGLAVNFHGVSRETADLDLLVPREDLEGWKSSLAKMGYTVLNETSAFLQFTPPEAGAWPVDLMLVPAQTFELMLGSAVEAAISNARVKVPSLLHLLALKLHALAHASARRFMKDYLDVENLVAANRLDLNADEVKAVFLKYGTADLYEKLKRTIGQ